MSDDTLLTEFTLQGSESAFAALVRRHVDLVYATAKRQLGDAALAEEVTQNVFIALARKSGRLRGSATIAGWLYQTTLLEARQALRSKLRRQRRETMAFELSSVARDGESPWAALVPLLDDGLTRLREGDRLAVLLRFFEGRPFREVGRLLGISEDAAQKRVAKSLGELADYFQNRGFGGSSLSLAGAGMGALFAEAAFAAPSHLASVAAQAGSGALSAGASGFGWWTVNIMKISKLQWTIGCACLVAVPIAFEARAVRSTRLEASRASAELAEARQGLADVERQRNDLNQKLNEPATAVVSTPPFKPGPPNPSPSPAWADSSTFARVPRDLLERLKIRALRSDWKLRRELASILGLTPAEFTGAERALEAYYARTSALEESHLELVSGGPDAGAGRPVVFHIARYEPEANAARQEFRRRLVAEVGEVRAGLILRYLDFAPVTRAAPENGVNETGDYFEQSGHSSDRWNFHGYERTITMETGAGKEPALSVAMKIGGQDGMSFGGGQQLFNPAVAPTLKARWELLIRPQLNRPK